jgi:23S rRNA (adenine2503-C2)-methyltransferase
MMVNFQQSEDATNAYIKALESNGIVVKVRRSRGKDIDAMWAISNKQA